MLLNNTWDERTSPITAKTKNDLEKYFKNIFDATINFIEKNK